MTLDQLRQAIDAIDDQILELLNQRAERVKKVGDIKQKSHLDLYAPNREQAIFDRLEQRNRGPFPAESIFRVFREIISASLALEQPIRVVYLGPRATFTHVAALNLFGASAQLLPQQGIPAIFEEVENDRAQYGVAPIENSNEGAVVHTLEMFAKSDLKIIAEHYLRVTHSLLSRGESVADVKRIYSHPQALEQCRHWLERHCPNKRLIEVESTARAAQIAAEETGSAAVASAAAAQLYRLNPLAEHIEDHQQNLTRFLVIGRKTPQPTGMDKTSILFSFHNKSGMLSKALTPFNRRGLDLTKIESHPIKHETWEYHFFIDIEGHIQDKAVREAMDELTEICHLVKHLGSYPKAR